MVRSHVGEPKYHIMKKPWNEHNDQELVNELSGYHKAIHGYRPTDRTVYEDRDRMLGELKTLDKHMRVLQGTLEGRNYLRSRGWQIGEPQ